jgi:hypothetical protein
MVSDNTHKRLTPASLTEGSLTADSTPKLSNKRQRDDDGCFVARKARSAPAYITPPLSAWPTPNKHTIPLTLKIPEHVPTEKERRQMISRKGAATKWEHKLQNPYPDDKEIKKSYNLKLMRYYPRNPTLTNVRTDGGSAPASAPTSSSAVPPAEPTFTKPIIQKSSRVTKLLKSYPALRLPAAVPELVTKSAEEERGLENLHNNKAVIRSSRAEKLAWKSFAKPDYPTREVMVESALPGEDLVKEHRGKANNLPEWKKHRTGKFAIEKQNRK